MMALKNCEISSSLGQSCNELRGGMDASQYKDYVLVLLFIKYISDKYAGVPFAPIIIPDGASFKDLVALKGKPDIGDQINKKIIAPLANANKLSDFPDFNDATKLGSGKEMVDRLTNLIAIFENPALDFSKNRADGDDILGDAYEYLMRQLGQARPRLLCSLVHKFGRRDVEDFDAFIKELEAQHSQTVGEVFVFVDECHRTQSGKLHRAMKAMMPSAVFIGFTGTPLLKKDRQTSLQVFGGYIHTYKFSEAVDDKVVLDLVYEARDIDQRLGSEDKIDAWFEAKTRGLNDWQKDELKKHWGTMQKVLSSRSRMERVVSDMTSTL